MSHDIRVCVSRFSDRPTFQLQWKDPITGKKRTQTTDILTSTGQRGRRAAERLAGELEKELGTGLAQAPAKLSWEAFRSRYENEVVPSLATQTGAKIQTVFNHLDQLVTPQRLHDMTEERISYFAAALRKTGVSETTIKSYLAHLQAMLNWGVEQKLLRTLPTFPRVHRKKKSSSATPMKGRPITTEEFSRMLAAVPKVVGEAAAPEWQRYLRGLWVSGLRLQESLQLHWDRQGGLVPVFPEKGRPTLLIPADLEKGHTDRILPIAPEFALFLLETPVAERTGHVFQLWSTKGEPRRLQARRVSEIVSDIGRAAGVVVHVDAKDSEKLKYASAHDFRRAFGERWAARIMPAQLKELMRHASIETTLRYYVGTNAERTADACWEAYEKACGHPEPPTPSAAAAAVSGRLEGPAASTEPHRDGAWPAANPPVGQPPAAYTEAPARMPTDWSMWLTVANSLANSSPSETPKTLSRP